MFLLINSANDDGFEIGLASIQGKLVAKKAVKGHFIHCEKILPEIDKMLSSKKVKLNDLQGIAVVCGPGGFTSLRAGIVVANSLSYSLRIPVVSLKKSSFRTLFDFAKKSAVKLRKGSIGRLIKPFYGRSPNITSPKRKLIAIKKPFH